MVEIDLKIVIAEGACCARWSFATRVSNPALSSRTSTASLSKPRSHSADFQQQLALHKSKAQELGGSTELNQCMHARTRPLR